MDPGEWQTVTSNKAKTKQNASQRKENQKSNQKTANVPAPQPAKSNSKTNKKNEINNKGASKEGNEMEVFQIAADTVNANIPAPPPATVVTPTTNNSDVINANTVPATNNVAPTPPPVVNSNSNLVDANNKKNDNNDAVTTKPVPEVKVHQKVDVTNVFGGKVPKPSPFVPPSVPSGDANRDETDRSAQSNDKLVLSKNEANVKTASTDEVENKPELPYRKGQWSPFNLNGDKIYERDFLMAVRNLALSKVKPPNLPEVVDSTLDGNRPRLSENRYSMGRTDFTNPPFMNPFGGKNSSMKGQQSLMKHPSLSGKSGNKGGKSTNGASKISISLREEVKLHESENAWKPGRLVNKGDGKSEEERKTEELYKKVRGVLNKLTPQKFDTLLQQIKNLKIDNVERLQGVINLVFEKAVDEPNFSVAYARMCNELSLMQVPSGPDKKDAVNFRKLLINRCQEEFENHSKDETLINTKKTEIELCTDLEKKKDLEFELEEIYRRTRMRSVGNVRFIGELFKSHMLTTNIMFSCLQILLDSKDEESLECLCKLLSTIGKELEKSGKDLSKFFTIMQEIVDKKHVKCSSRIRFMLQDVIDLRKNKWVPRRQDLNPKTIDQIQKEAENEHLNQAINSVPNTPRKDDRMGGSMNRGKSKVNEDGWTVQTSQRPIPLNLNKDKLKMKAPSENEPLGEAMMFTAWSKGSHMKPQGGAMHSSLTNTNKFSLLDSSSMDNDKKMSGGGRYKDSAYSSKGSSLERGSYGKQSYDNRAGSRSGSQHRRNDSPVPFVPPQRIQLPILPVVSAAPVRPTPPPAQTYPEMSDELKDRFFKNCLEEFINDNCTFEECADDIKEKIPVPYMRRIVADGYMNVLERYNNHRLKTGILFAKLIEVGVLPVDEYCLGLEEIFSQCEDLVIDIPTIWSCLAQILVGVLPIIPLTRLHKSSEVLISSGCADKLLAPLFKLTVSDKGPNFLRDIWQESKLNLADFIPADKVEKFIKDNQLEFLTGGQTAQGNSGLNYSQIEKKLLKFFDSNASFDEICNWITANVGERVKENQFIRTLATAIYKYSIVRTKLDSERLNSRYKLFQKYVDNNQAYELQCLYALQSLANQLEHPQGLLLSIFNKLNEDVIFPQESFIAWESSTDPAEQEGKGVALKQLTAFFTQLKENDIDDEEEYGSTGSEEA